MVLALVIILDEARSENIPVGPILMLSYKNHALDEFLLDVLKNMTFRQGMLIRTGKPDNTELTNFSEISSKEE